MCVNRTTFFSFILFCGTTLCSANSWLCSKELLLSVLKDYTGCWGANTCKASVLWLRSPTESLFMKNHFCLSAPPTPSIEMAQLRTGEIVYPT